MHAYQTTSFAYVNKHVNSWGYVAKWKLTMTNNKELKNWNYLEGKSNLFFLS